MTPETIAAIALGVAIVVVYAAIGLLLLKERRDAR